MKQVNSDSGAVVEHEVPAGVVVDRAILLGGQALAVARGNAGDSRAGAFPMNWTEVRRDHGNSIEIGAGQMDGKMKFRFTGSDNRITDFGCAVMDSYAPDPRTDEGKTLIAALQTATGM